MTESPDEDYRRAAVDLLGAIAYGELSAFERLVEDAKLAPGIDDKIAIGAMATAEFGHLQKLVERLEQLGADPAEAMQVFRPGFDSFHAHTAPADYYEGLIKAYVGDGLAADFYREIAAYLDPETREVIISSLEDAGQTAFIVERVRAGIAEDHRLGGPRAPGAARRGRSRLADGPAGRGSGPARPRPGRAGPDVRPAHRAARGPDGRARPRLLTRGALRRRGRAGR